MLDVTSYLKRLRLADPGPVSIEGLTALQRAHVERIPYSTLDIQLGRPGTINPVHTSARIAATGRTGYCYQLNGAFAALLEALGYDVIRHRGCVTIADRPMVVLEPYPNHLALTVRGLPTAGNPDGVWFVDTGLGDAIHEPVPLRSGTVRQGIFTYAIRTSTALTGGWRFEHDLRGSFAAMDFEPAQTTMAAFDAGHAFLSTAPQSGFVKYLIMQRRDQAGVDKLNSLSLRRVDAHGESLRELMSPGELFAVIADVFGLPLDDLDTGDRARLWRQARAAQDAWKGSLDGVA